MSDHRLLGAALAVGLSHAAFAQDFEGARLLGHAGAQRALSTDNDAIYVNPGGLAMGSLYLVELGYLDDLRSSDRRFNASIVDSQAGPIAAGLAYTYTKRRPDDQTAGEQRLVGHRAELSLATQLVENTAALGFTARYVTFSRVDGETDLGQGFNVFTLDAGIQWRVVDWLRVGLAGYNLTNPKEAELPISWGAGLGLAVSGFTAEADIRYNAQIGKAQWSGTAGYVLAGLLPVRAGVTYDVRTQGLHLSAGLGFIVDRVMVDLGYRQKLNGDRVNEDDDERMFAVGLRGQFF